MFLTNLVSIAVVDPEYLCVGGEVAFEEQFHCDGPWPPSRVAPCSTTVNHDDVITRADGDSAMTGSVTIASSEECVHLETQS